MKSTGIGIDDYPVYNHPERPGIGRDHLGNLQYNCFSVSLEKQDKKYLPFTFKDFVRQFNEHYQNTCNNCIANSQIYTFGGFDRSAVDLKFRQKDEYFKSDEELKQEIREARASCHYCPLVADTLSSSVLEPIQKWDKRAKDITGNIEPIDAILDSSEHGDYSGAWDDSYFFKILGVRGPSKFASICSICSQLASERFIPQNAEKKFLKLYLLSVFQHLNEVAHSESGLYLEEEDFRYDSNKFFDFIFPIPQVWIYIIPKPPAGSNWRDWEDMHKSPDLPQRVDFMLTYEGERHIIELDGASHYSSKDAYRKTLIDNRWLRRCGYQSHRFENSEILELCPSSGKPNLEGFKDLLYSEGIDLEKIVLAKTHLQNE